MEMCTEVRVLQDGAPKQREHTAYSIRGGFSLRCQPGLSFPLLTVVVVAARMASAA